MEVKVGCLRLEMGQGSTARSGNQNRFFPMGRSDSAVSAYTLQKETEDAPKERKRPTEVFKAGPRYTGMGLSRGGGTHLLATVTAAEAQAVETQLSAWPPPCH